MNIRWLLENFEENLNRLMERGSLASRIGEERAVLYFQVIQIVIEEKYRETRQRQ